MVYFRITRWLRKTVMKFWILEKFYVTIYFFNFLYIFAIIARNYEFYKIFSDNNADFTKILTLINNTKPRNDIVNFRSTIYQ